MGSWGPERLSCSPPSLSTQGTTLGVGVGLGPIGQIVTLLPVPRSLATMDKILEAVVTSSYPASVKQGLVRRVLEAARQPLEREQCLALLALGTRLYVSGADELPRRVGCQLLHVAGRHHPEVFAEFFSARRVLRLLQGGAGPPSARALACVQLCLQLLPEGPGADEVFALLRREVLRTVCERPGPAVCAQVARLLARHPRCVPDGPHRLLFCQQLVRCLGRFRCPAEGEEGAVEFLEQAQQVSGLLAQLWRAQPAAILPCLKELFAVISCTGACALGPQWGPCVQSSAWRAPLVVWCMHRGVWGDVPLLSRPLLSSCGWRWGLRSCGPLLWPGGVGGGG